MVKKRTVCRRPKALVEFGEFNVRLGGATSISRVESRQRTNGIRSLRKALRLEIWSFQIRLAKTRFTNPVWIVLGGNLILDNFTCPPTEAQISIVELQIPFAVD